MALNIPISPATQTKNPGAIAPALAKVGAQQNVALGAAPKAKNTKPGGLKKRTKAPGTSRTQTGGMGVGNGQSY